MFSIHTSLSVFALPIPSEWLFLRIGEVVLTATMMSVLTLTTQYGLTLLMTTKDPNQAKALVFNHYQYSDSDVTKLDLSTLCAIIIIREILVHTIFQQFLFFLPGWLSIWAVSLGVAWLDAEIKYKTLKGNPEFISTILPELITVFLFPWYEIMYATYGSIFYTMIGRGIHMTVVNLCRTDKVTERIPRIID